MKFSSVGARWRNATLDQRFYLLAEMGAFLAGALAIVLRPKDLPSLSGLSLSVLLLAAFGFLAWATPRAIRLGRSQYGKYLICCSMHSQFRSQLALVGV